MFMNLKRAKLLAYCISVCFLLIHILMLLIFLQCSIPPLVRFNIFSICFYIAILFVIHKEWFPLFTISVYLEVVAHMTFAILLTGWETGFQVTLIGMNVLAFYAEYTGRSLKLCYLKVMPLCVIGMIMYLASYIHLHFNAPIYSLTDDVVFALNILWGIIVFVISSLVLQLLVIITNSSEEELAYELSHDKLTGLPNRYYLSEQLDSIKNDKSYFWLCISDIDDFKKINDTYGHNCGDYVLKTIGDLLATKEILCCRWGGEEFLFVGRLEQNYPDPRLFLEEVRKEIQNYSFEYDGIKFQVTMTFGLSTFSNGDNIDNVLRDADDKLYLGKQNGKNQVVTKSAATQK